MIDDDPAPAVPAVYIADLAAYVEGTLVGRWFKPGDYSDAEDFSAAVSTYITALPHPAWTGPREEWAIHDYEGFGQYRVSEYESLTSVWTVASLIAEHGMAYPAFVSLIGAEYATEEKFQDAFAGEWPSEKDFAQNWFEETSGEIDPWDKPWPYNCIDWDWATRELMMGDLSSMTTGKGDGSVFIFRSI